ncbi:unnamed protein product [Didymodactylos carnosus]|uniref:Uncharacterized protein n=1 Tax=Didymodactylos carnosus TaxID=1234261 RepID=A0A814V904_9BILA|nr:unnamed protein product [Didymodactylos carnosus]CAF1185802.1 unnamed protein product [Didymodactylos carnosus]CAF3538752.1 unnamed protein product [Didymodactylos carnosus]CAF3950062.1 unnamed protein product [Didymodactylos carnosus]
MAECDSLTRLNTNAQLSADEKRPSSRPSMDIKYALLVISVSFTLLALVFSITALLLPYWKLIRLGDNRFDYSSIDSLIRTPVKRFFDSMYHITSSKSSTDLTGLVQPARCGHNYIPKFNANDFKNR